MDKKSATLHLQLLIVKIMLFCFKAQPDFHIEGRIEMGCKVGGLKNIPHSPWLGGGGRG